MQAMPANTGSWGVFVKALRGEQVLEGSMREYQLQMYLLSRSDLAEGRPALEEWVKCEEVEGWTLYRNGAHLSQVRVKVYF